MSNFAYSLCLNFKVSACACVWLCTEVVSNEFLNCFVLLLRFLNIPVWERDVQ